MLLPIDMDAADLDLVALLGANLRYLDEVNERYQADPGAVDSGFSALIRSGGETGFPLPRRAPRAPMAGPAAYAGVGGAPSSLNTGGISDAQVSRLIEAYRSHGHLAVALDPLDIDRPPGHPELVLEAHGFTSA